MKIKMYYILSTRKMNLHHKMNIHICLHEIKMKAAATTFPERKRLEQYA